MGPGPCAAAGRAAGLSPHSLDILTVTLTVSEVVPEMWQCDRLEEFSGSTSSVRKETTFQGNFAIAPRWTS